MKRRKISHWRFWVMLTEKEKAKLYPKLKPSEIKRKQKAAGKARWLKKQAKEKADRGY